MAKLDLTPFIEKCKERGLNMEGVIVWQDGEERARHFFVPEYRRNQFSVSKSFTSAAVGFALEEGLFTLDEPVLKYFGEDAPAEPCENLKKLTLRDLLTMASGQDAAVLMGGDRPRIRQETDDFVKFALAYPFPYEPHTHFKYSNFGPYLIGVLIQRMTGKTLVEYLMPRLFEPLGITPAPHWETDPRGMTFGAGGLEINLSELFKFIKLYYDYGMLDGKQILPKAWIEQSTAKQVESGSSDPGKTDNYCGYGYLFWRGQHNSFRADGSLSKYGVILRDKKAIICINADEPRQQLVLDTMWETIYSQL